MQEFKCEISVVKERGRNLYYRHYCKTHHNTTRHFTGKERSRCALSYLAHVCDYSGIDCEKCGCDCKNSYGNKLSKYCDTCKSFATKD